MSEKKKIKGIVVSRLKNPVTVTLDGMSLIVPPKAHGKNAPRIAEDSVLGSLPTGVVFVPSKTK